MASVSSRFCLCAAALAALAASACAARPAQAQRVDQALAATVASHAASRAIQTEIDRLAGALGWLDSSREERDVQAQMRAVSEQIDALNARIAASEEQRARQRQTEAALLPLMRRMLDGLDELIDHDLPFARSQRHAQVSLARAALGRHDLSMVERYGAVLEAWLREVSYGYSSAVSDGEVTIDGQQRHVRQLRAGRSALYYVTVDGGECGVWLRASQRYATLAPDDCATLASVHEGDDLALLLAALPLDGEAPR